MSGPTANSASRRAIRPPPGASFGAIVIWRLRWLARIGWNHLWRIATAFLIVGVGVLLSFIAREPLLHGVVSSKTMLALISLVSLLFVVVALLNHLYQSSDSALETILAIFVAVFGAFAITNYWFADATGTFLQFVENVWNRNLEGILPPIDLSDTPLPDAANEFRALADRGGQIINTALATLVTATVFVSTPFIVKYLKEIIDLIGWSEFQKSVAKKMLLPSQLAIPKNRRVDELYPKHVTIDRTKLQRNNPSIKNGGMKARIKLLFDEKTFTASDEVEFDWESVAGVLHAENIDIDKSLIFIVFRDEWKNQTIVGYGTGSELSALFEMSVPYTQDPLRTIGNVFTGILNGRWRAPDRSRREHMPIILNQARQEILKRHPHGEVMLSSLVLDQSINLEHLIEAIKYDDTNRDEIRGVNRVLLTSKKRSMEIAIVGASEIAKFLSSN